MAMADRQIHVDVYRGILVVYIVLVVHGLYWLALTQHSLKSLVLFEMPAIFLVSGYSCALYETALGHPVLSVGVKGYANYLISRSTRLLIPYFGYAIVCAIIAYVARSDPFRDVLLAWINPFVLGQDKSFSTLNYHLWFVPVYLIVTMALPIATQFVKYHLLTALLIGIAVINVIYTFHLAKLPAGNAAMTLSFYLFWALLGYRLAQKEDWVRASHFGAALLVSAAGFALILAMHQSSDALDLQKHKFPPDHIFFMFNCVWVFAILWALKAFAGHRARAEWLANQLWFKPFMASGYSIYLWQGLGYTIAIGLGATAGLSTVAVWGIGFLLSVVLGMLASPLERIRVPRAFS
jgi:fucose 4-O-acetylase-like acetyltransferase